MASLKVLTKIVCLIFATMVVCAPQATQALTCTDVTEKLVPCFDYLKQGGSIPPNCCVGVKNLVGMAKTKTDRVEACKCILPLAKSVGINYDLANKLPADCGVDDFKIDFKPNMDCSTIEYYSR